MRTRAWIFGILGSLSIWSCDTASSIDPPENSFFVKFYGDNGNQEGVDAVLNVDGTITLLGTNEVGGIKQLYLVNIEQNGNVVWENTITTPTAATAKDIELTSDGRYAIVADVADADGNNDILTMTLTLGGTLIDSVKIGLSKSGRRSDEEAISITQIRGGFIVTGSTDSLEVDVINSGTGDTQDALILRFTDNLVPYPNSWANISGSGDIDFGVKVFQDELVDTTFYSFKFTDFGQPTTDFYVEALGAGGESRNGIPISEPTTDVLSSVIRVPAESGDGYLLAGLAKGPVNDILVVRWRKMNYAPLATDLQAKKTLAIDLGPVAVDKVSVCSSRFGGFLILANDKSTGIQNFFLTKITNSLTVEWSNPIIFGGEMDDQIGSVLELPDGSIGIIGTFAIGQDGEKKMTFIKVNRDGKFSK